MDRITLLDIAKRSGNDRTVGLVEAVSKVNQWFQNLRFREIIGGSYKVGIRVEQPVVQTRKFNDGIDPTKSTVVDKRYSTYLYNSRSIVDVALASTSADGVALLREEEDRSHLYALANLFSYHCFYGDNQADPTVPDGIATIVNSTAVSTYAEGTASSSKTSIYIASFDSAATIQGVSRGIEGIVTQGQNLQLIDRGIQYLPGANGKMNQFYTTEISAMLGFAVYDTRAVGRIAKINASNPPSMSTVDSVIIAMKPFVPSGIFVNRTGLKIFNSFKTSGLQFMPADRDVKNLVATYDGIPIYLDDNISDNET